MRAGPLRERLALQTNTPVQDSYGQPVESWSTTATVWASVERSTGTERAMTSQEQVVIGEAVFRIRIRWRGSVSVSVKQRLVWTVRSRTFAIEAVLDGSGREEILLLCREVQS
jgi:SPP1 family predicted phage head-tail adaptor